MPSAGHFTGRYNDGLSARTSPVVVLLGGHGLRIVAGDGTTIGTWPGDQVHLTAPPQPPAPIRLQCADDPARLTIEDPTVLASLKVYCPNLRVGITTSRREWRKIAVWSLAAIAVALSVLFLVIPAGAKWFATRIPAPLEARLGRQVVDQITSIFARTQGREVSEIVCANPAGTEVLSVFTERLEQAAATGLPVTITVIDHPLVNAFALPGGQILLFRGLIDGADSGDQIAGVLAHEVGHVLHRHPTEIALKNTAGAGLISLLVGDFTGGTAIVAATQLLLTTSNTRAAERQADAAAVQLLNNLGISAGPLAEFFNGADKAAFDGFLGYLSTHPADADRAATVRALGTATGTAMTNQQWQALQQICG